MSKHEFYNIFIDMDSGGFAKAPEFDIETYFSCYRQFRGKLILDWKAIHCFIHDPILKGEPFEDYQSVIHGFRLCSQRMKDLFEKNKSPDDKIQWLDATVTWNRETRPYYILHFYENTDVIDPVLSKWNSQTKTCDAIPKVFIGKKIGNHNIFSYPYDTIGLTVRAFLIEEMKKQKMTGMMWKPAIVR